MARVRTVSVWTVRQDNITQSFRYLFKLDTLGQWQLLGVVDGASRAPHVLLPCVRPRLPPTTSVLFPTKGTANLCPVGRNVDVDDATI